MNKQFLLFSFYLICGLLFSQTNAPTTNGIQTYVNPILPGDHPDQTLMRVGGDFYSTGSNFHFTPYLPILHSTDLMHWEVIARVIPPTSSIPNNDSPSAGTWQGALAQFGGKFWVYFSNNAGGGQYFCNATNMKGPWSSPTKVNTNTGVYGYDNSVFVDDDGTPYLLLKNGQANNGLQKLDPTTGQPTGSALNMNWVNANNIYSWAEGPVMCKRNGRYYMFVAGNVTGGQYVLSSAKLSNVESDWTRHGNFWQTATSAGGFTGPNHITQPILLDDGTWWCLSHAYDNGGWEGQGRQSHLHKVVWDANGVPKGVPVNTNPVLGPNLPSSKINYEFIKSDEFESTTLSVNWHFFNKTMASTSRYSLTEKPGYLRLKPGTDTTHILQKDKGRYYSLTTVVDLTATTNGQQAGIKLTSGNDKLFYDLYTGYNNGKKIGVYFNGTRNEISNTIGNTVWLRVERALHVLTSFYSADGITWTQLATTDVSALDKSQASYNEWVGTSVGLYALNTSADFSRFIHRYGFVNMKAQGRNNWFGVTNSTKTPGTVLTNSTSGDWFMLAGVDMGESTKPASQIVVNAASASGNASLEVWIDNISGSGTKIATVPITSTGGADTWKDFTASFTSVSGQHDVYIRIVGAASSVFVNTFKFASNGSSPTITLTSPANNATYVTPASITISATASDADGTISKVDFYNGTTLLNSDASSPYSYSWTNVAAGTYYIKAIATDNQGNTCVSEIDTIKVNVAQAPYGGTAWVIPGIIQAENYDVGGNGFAYSDSTSGNSGGASFRTDEDVDLETCTDAGGGYNLGWATKGEWLEYTVKVNNTATYDLDLRVACNGTGRTLSVSMDGVNIASNVAIPNTGGWQTWQTVTVSGIPLTAGQKVMRITVGNTDYVNLNYVEYKVVTDVEELEVQTKRIYPNPFTNNFTIELEGNSSYQLTNANGQVLTTGSNAGTHLLGNELPKGIYFIRVTSNSKTLTYKLVKE
ncbi:MAG: family 43 glycosylhydrolase [Cytophagales bacterium]